MRVLFLGPRLPTPNMLAERVYGWLTQRVEVVELTEPEGGFDLGVCCGYTRIVPKSVLDVLPIANLHTGYLPWNRGRFPNVWPLLDGSPAGVTIHWMDEGIDTGPIIAQERVSVDPWETAETLYRKLEDAGFALFTREWDRIANRCPGYPQRGPGTTHRASDLDLVRFHQSWPMWRALDILRARSFPGYGMPVTEPNGDRWEVSVTCRRLAQTSTSKHE